MKFSLKISTVVLALFASILPSANGGEIFFDTFDDNTIDPSKWTTSGTEVVESEQFLKVLQNETDAGGNIESLPIPINPTGKITMSRDARLHYSNEYFMGATDLLFGDLPLASISYGHIAYDDQAHQSVYGIYISRNNAWPHSSEFDPADISEKIDPIWDTWFTETIVYDPQSGDLEYWIDDELKTTFNIGAMPAIENPELTIRFDSWGWWTGHSHHMDNLSITQEEAERVPVLYLSAKEIYTPLEEHPFYSVPPGLFAINPETALALKANDFGELGELERLAKSHEIEKLWAIGSNGFGSISTEDGTEERTGDLDADGLAYHAPTNTLYGTKNGDLFEIDPTDGSILEYVYRQDDDDNPPFSRNSAGLASDGENTLYTIADHHLFAFNIKSRQWNKLFRVGRDFTYGASLAFDERGGDIFLKRTGDPMLLKIDIANQKVSPIGTTGIMFSGGLAFAMADSFPVIDEGAIQIPPPGNVFSGSSEVSTFALGDIFGISTNLSESSTLYLGSSHDDDFGGISGSVFVYTDTEMDAPVKLYASDAAPEGFFGKSLGSFGDNLLVGGGNGGGSYYSDLNIRGSGSAYFFRDISSLSNGSTENLRMMPAKVSSAETGTQFGTYLDLGDDIAVVSDYLEPHPDHDSAGIAYVFRNFEDSSGIIHEIAKLIPSEPFEGTFGKSVSLSANSAIIGADTGAYLYRSLDTATDIQTENALLRLSDTDSSGYIGYNISLKDDIALVSRSEDETKNFPSVYVFQNVDQAEGSVVESAKLMPSIHDVSFGSFSPYANVGNKFVSQDQNRAAVGYANFGIYEQNIGGSVFLFSNLDSASGETFEDVWIFPTPGNSHDLHDFGSSVSLVDDWISMTAGSPITGDSTFVLRVSAVTTFDEGDTSLQLDPLGFESRIDWVIGETSDENEITIGVESSATVVQPDKAIFIGKNAGSDDNRLLIGGDLTATTVVIGSPDGNSGNTLEILPYADVEIGEIRIAPGNQLVVEGNYADATELLAHLDNPTLSLWNGSSWTPIEAGSLEEQLTFSEGGVRFTPGESSGEQIVHIPDPVLEAAIRAELNIPDGPISAVDMAQLEVLSVIRIETVGSLVGLEHAVNLKHLAIGENNTISDLTPLSGLSALEEFVLANGSHLTDLSPLVGSVNLSSLTVDGAENLSDISVLSQLSQLGWIRLIGNSISDLSSLSGLTQLTSLQLGANQISDLTPLQNLTNLEFLWLNDNQVADLSPLQNLVDLRRLNLSNNEISDAGPLQNLTQVETLWLSSNPLTDISALASLTSLGSLYLEDLTLTDISPIVSLSNLEALYLTGSSIPDLSPISGLTGLFQLHLNEMGITDLSFLQGLSGVHGLHLRSNNITDLSPLTGMQSLVLVRLDDNQIEDISALLDAPNLDIIHLSSNKLYLAPGSPDQIVVDLLREGGAFVEVENQSPDGPDYSESGAFSIQAISPSSGFSGTTVSFSGTGLDALESVLFHSFPTGIRASSDFTPISETTAETSVPAEPSFDEGAEWAVAAFSDNEAFVSLEMSEAALAVGGITTVSSTVFHGGGGRSYVVDDGGFMTGGFGSSVVFVRSGGSYHNLGGGSNLIFVKNGGAYTSDGGQENTVFYEGGASIQAGLEGTELRAISLLMAPTESTEDGIAGVLIPSDGSPLSSDSGGFGDGPDEFGWSVGVSGTHFLVGSPKNDDLGLDNGAAYFYRHPDTAGGPATEDFQIAAPAPVEFSNWFGYSVELNGSIAVIGTPNHHDFPTGPDQPDGTFHGAAFVYNGLESASADPGSSAKLIRSHDSRSIGFSETISLFETSALIADPFEDGDTGAAYLYRNLGTRAGIGIEDARLTGSDSEASDQFGFALDLGDGFAVVGAPYEDERKEDAGAVYFFYDLDQAAGEVSETIKLPELTGQVGALFGYSVSVNGSEALIGAPNFGRYVEGTGAEGRAWLFREVDESNASGFPFIELRAHDRKNFDGFGDRVALSGGNALVRGKSEEEFSAYPPGPALPYPEAQVIYAYLGLSEVTVSTNEALQLFPSAVNDSGNTAFAHDLDLDGDTFVISDFLAGESGRVYTGQLSTYSTLDEGGTSRILDGLSFRSLIDWTIGETTSANEILLPSGNSATIAPSKKIFIGKEADSNDNRLIIGGELTAGTVVIGSPDSNTGNVLEILSTADASIGTIRVYPGNGLVLEGEFSTLEEVLAALGSPLIEYWGGSAWVELDPTSDENPIEIVDGQTTVTVPNQGGGDSGGSGGGDTGGGDSGSGGDDPGTTQADFSIQSMTLDPQPTTTGQDFAATVVVKNEGDLSADAGLLRVWAARTSIPSFGETVSSIALQVGVLEPGATKTVSLPSGLSTPTDPGTYHARVLIDADGTTEEYSTGNNFGSATYTIFANNDGGGSGNSGGEEEYPDWAKADFSIQSVTIAPRPETTGQTFTASVVIKNEGSRPADAGFLRVWATKANAPSIGEDGADFEATVGILDAGESKTISIDSGLAAPPEEGTYHVRALVDADGTTAEYSTGNNFGSATYTVFKPIPDWMKTDLVVKSLRLSNQPKSLLESFEATVQIINEGHLPSPAGTQLSYWQSSPTYELSTDRDGLITLPTIAPGETIELSLENLQAPNQRGTFHTRVFIDPDNDIVEYSEGNNYGGATYTIFPPQLKIQRLANGFMKISWPSQAGREYTVERSTTGPAGGFSPVSEALPASPPKNSFTDEDVPDGSLVFYRVVIR